MIHSYEHMTPVFWFSCIRRDRKGYPHLALAQGHIDTLSAKFLIPGRGIVEQNPRTLTIEMHHQTHNDMTIISSSSSAEWQSVLHVFSLVQDVENIGIKLLSLPPSTKSSALAASMDQCFLTIITMY